MRKVAFILISGIFFMYSDLFCQETQIRHVDFLIENRANNDFQGVVWIDSKDVYSLIPEFNDFSFIVTTTHSPDLTTDLEILKTDELESQPLDEDSNGKIDKIGVYLSLKAYEKEVVTVHVGQADKIDRIKGNYKKFCDAINLSNEGEVFWESDKVCYSYNPISNIINIFGKMTYRNILDKITASYYNRLVKTTLGEELFITKKPPGFGKLGMLKENRVSGINEDKSKKVYVSGKGPIISSVNVLSTSNSGLRINSQYTLSKGSRWTLCDIKLSGNINGNKYVIGIPVRSDEKMLSGEGYIATFADLPALGLGIYVPEKYLVSKEEKDGYHLMVLIPDENGHIQYSFSAYWELEHNENIVERGELDVTLPNIPYMDRTKRVGRTLLRPQSRIDSLTKFEKQLNEDLASFLKNIPIVKRISEKAMTYTELYPPEAVRKNRQKSYDEALNLLIDRLSLMAEEGLSVKGGERFWITSKREGKMSFIKPNTSWGDGYWISMLWDAYHITGFDKFKEWALQSNRAMFGGEVRKSWDSGLNYWLGSVRSFKETKDPIWRESALKNADAEIELLSNAESFKIDLMICLPILYWAYQETKDEKYLKMAALFGYEKMMNLIEPNGASLQMIWYSKIGEILGIGTPQGSGGISRWSRGQGWTLSGYADVYILTGEKKYLNIFRLAAKWVMQNLPQDFVPWYDFDDQGVFYRYRDTSAASSSANALLQMSVVEPDKQLAKWYEESAIKIINSLIDNYLTKVSTEDPRPPGMLSHQCYIKTINDDYEQIWGSYYLMHSLILLKEKNIQRK